MSLKVILGTANAVIDPTSTYGAITQPTASWYAPKDAVVGTVYENPDGSVTIHFQSVEWAYSGSDDSTDVYQVCIVDVDNTILYFGERREGQTIANVLDVYVADRMMITIPKIVAQSPPMAMALTREAEMLSQYLASLTGGLALSTSIAIPAIGVNPSSQTAGTINGTAIDLRDFNRVMWVLGVGSVGDAGTVDAHIEQSADGSSGWTTLASSAITQVTASNKWVTLETRHSSLGSGQHFARFVLVIGVNPVLVSLVPIATTPVQPASDEDDASVVQRKSA